MKVGWIQLGGAACAAVLAVLVSAPVRAADSSGGVTAVAAEELDKRSKQAQEEQGEGKGMSDSAVRVLMTYAFSIIPEESTGPDGKVTKVDKSDPNKFLIPNDDARRVIRAATRTAYAEVCQMPELGRANFETLMKGEEARKTWTPQQLQMINALHIFSVSYFTGNIKITAKEEPAETPATAGVGDNSVATAGAETDPAPEDQETTTRTITSEAPNCPESQKQKVTNAINAYVQAAQAKP
jgi:hypothetical protein